MSSLRPLWRRQLPLLAAAALFFCGNLAFFLVYRSGWQTRREALEARRAELRHTAEAKDAEAQKLVSQKDRLGHVSSAIDAFYGNQIGSERETLAAIVAELHAVLKSTGVSAPQIAYATGSVKSLPLTQMRITFAVHCDYTRFKQLLHAFETNRRWIAVRSVQISRSDAPGSIVVQMELVTYFAEAEPPKPAGKDAENAAAARRAG